MMPTRIARPGGLMRLIGVVLVVISLFIGSIAAYAIRDTQGFLDGAVPIMAQVQSIDRIPVADGNGYLYRPTFVFSDTRKRLHVAPALLATPEYDFEAGSQVAILFNPQMPANVRVDDPVNLWFLSGILSAVSGISLLLGIWLIRAAGRRRRAANPLRVRNRPEGVRDRGQDAPPMTSLRGNKDGASRAPTVRRMR